MNSKQTNKTPDERLYSSLRLAVILISVISSLLFAFGLTPLIAYVNSDGTIPFWPDALDLLLQAFHLVVFFACYAITYFCIYRFPFKKSIPIIAVFSAATPAKHFLNMLSEFFVFSSIPEDVSKAVFSVIVQSLLELAQYGVVIAIAFTVFKKHKEKERLVKAGSAKLNRHYDERASVFPFKKLFSTSNPLQRAALFGTTAICLFRVLPRIYYDIFYYIFSMGSTSFADVIWILVYYSSDVLFCFLGYALMMIIFNKSDTKDLLLRAKAKN